MKYWYMVCICMILARHTSGEPIENEAFKLAVNRWWPGYSTEEINRINEKAAGAVPKLLRMEKWERSVEMSLKHPDAYRIATLNQDGLYDWYGMIVDGTNATYLDSDNEITDYLNRIILKNSSGFISVAKFIEAFGWFKGYLSLGEGNERNDDPIVMNFKGNCWNVTCTYSDEFGVGKMSYEFIICEGIANTKLLRTYLPYK